MALAIYPGVFDPLTNGHVDIVKRALNCFEKVFFAIATSHKKSMMFDSQERFSLAKTVLADLDNVEVIMFHGLIVDCAREHNATIIIRGLRNSADADYEFKMSLMNRKLAPEIETVFFNASAQFSFLSSSLVREIASLRGDVSTFVDKPVALALNEKCMRYNGF